jgi:hypothetical protein
MRWKPTETVAGVVIEQPGIPHIPGQHLHRPVPLTCWMFQTSAPARAAAVTNPARSECPP